VLGAGGFIGRALSARLAARNVLARTVTRANSGTLDAQTDWPALLDGARIVVHLASAAAAPRDRDWTAKEVATAQALGRAARQCGIARLVLMSSIKAMAEASGAEPLRADAAPAPGDRYGRTKLAIEEALADVPGLAILRPPLVYGPEVKGSFRLLLAAAARSLPLPLASIRNRRAFVFIDNLLDVIEALLAAEAPRGVYMVRDDDEVSTPELLRRMARHLASRPRLLPCPPGLLRAALGLAGRGDVAAALLDSLAIDDSATRTRLGWKPRVSLDDGLEATCRWFRETAP
jgi:UDP-glucose 4-epimerase